MKLTEKEKDVTRRLGHGLYTVEFLEAWLDRKDNVFINTAEALQYMGAQGFYAAVRCMAQEGGES